MTTTATRIPNLPSATVVSGSDYLIVFQGGVTKKVQADALPASSAAWGAITGKPTTISGYAITDAYTKAEVDTALSGKQPTDADLTAIAELTGTTGLLKKTAANTWTLDTSAYVTSSGVTSVSGTAPIVSSGGATPAISISAATTSAAGSMSAADKTKLDGIAAGAQVNVATNIAEGTRTTTTVPITSSTGTGATLSAATTSLAGVMTSTDKTKLDGIAAGAQVNVATNLAQGTRTTTAVPITSSTGTSATLDSATTSLAGVMSAADKTKLDGIATGATNYTHPASHPPSIITQDASNRFVTDAEKATWNAKQNALGYTAENTANKGAANGYAGLDATGKVPSAQLPSYVDDVLEYTNLAAFPATGSAGVMYVALDTNKVYRWSGSAYVYITSGAVDSVAGKTGVVTLVKADVGLGNVDNTADSAKPVSTAQQTALNAKEGTITAGTTSQFWRGDKTWQDLFTEVRAATLTGLSTATNAVITATDTVLGALGKLQAQVTAHFGAGGTAHSNVVAGGSAGFMSGADKTKLDGIAASANNYSLPAATDTVLGGIELGSATVQTTAANAVTTTASRTYALQVNAAGQGVTNVPWTDTVYTHPATDGNLHVPATGTTNNGKVLMAGPTAGNFGWVTPNAGTVTSVAVSVPAFLSVSGSPITSSGTIAISYSGTALPLANGGTGATTAAAARTNLGAAESVQQAGSAFDFNNYRPSTPGLLRVVWNSGDTSMVNAPNGNTTGFLLASQGSHDLWNSQLFMEQGASGSVWSRGSSDAGGTRSWGTWRKQLDSSNYNSYAPTLTGTGASGTWGISVTGNAATVTNGVYTSGTYNDPAWLTGVNYSKLTGTVPTWNQNTTGTAANVTGTVALANGGTGATAAAGARTNLGATTVGSNLFTLTNPSAVTFLRFNADNTVSALDAATFRTAIGAGTSSTVGTVTSVGGTGTVSGLTLSGTVTSTGNLTLGGTLAVTPSNFASQTANTVLAAPNGAAGAPTFRALVAADVPTLNQNTTGSAATLTTGRTIGMTGDVTWTSPAFNGSGNVTAAATLANSGVTAGTYNNSATAITPYTVDAKGRITATGAAVTITPAWGSVTGKPTTVGGYGISDAAYFVAYTSTGDATNTTPWAKLATFNSGTTQYAEAQYILAVTTSISGVGAQTVLLSVYVRSHATNAVPDTYIHMLGKNGAEVHLSDDAFKVINGAWSSNHELWIRRNSGYGQFFVYLLSKNNSGFTETWHANAAWQTAVPTGANVNRTTNGVETPGKSTAKTFTSTVATGTAPLTVASTTVVPNLNADLLDGAHVGTSGATIPLLSTANTWGNNQTFSGNSSGAMVTITNAGSGVGLALDDFTVTSSTVVTNLNADYLDGVHKQDLMNRSGSSAAAYNFEAGAYFGLNAYYDTAWRARNTQNGWFAFRNGDNGTGLQLFVQDGAVTAGATVTYDTYAWRDGDFFSGSNKYWHAGNDGASSGLDADLLDGQQGSFYQNAGNLNAGTLPDARLPTRLGTVAASIADWNTAITNGYYMGAGATNAPTASIWYIGHVVAHNSLWVTQTVWGFANNSETTDTYTYRREMNNGTWTAWERIWQTQSELDARYLNASNLTAGTLPEARLPTNSDRTRKITVSVSPPSGGADGDIWFMYSA